MANGASRYKRGCIGGAIALAIVGGSVALYVFLAVESMRGIFVDEVVELADNQSQDFDLLVPGRKIPKSSTKITAHVAHFQDATNYTVKFDAPLADAKTFMFDTVGAGGSDCRRWLTTTRLSGWPTEPPHGALCRQDTDRKPKDERPITIAVIPHGPIATVLVYTTM